MNIQYEKDRPKKNHIFINPGKRKSEESRQIAQDLIEQKTAEFLSRGGKIQEIPTGLSGDYKNLTQVNAATGKAWQERQNEPMTCSRCKEVKTKADFQSRPDLKSGYKDACKKCAQLASARKCIRCGETKPSSYFTKTTTGYKPKCKKCRAEEYKENRLLVK